jgi:hypothetical protein
LIIKHSRKKREDSIIELTSFQFAAVSACTVTSGNLFIFFILRDLFMTHRHSTGMTAWHTIIGTSQYGNQKLIQVLRNSRKYKETIFTSSQGPRTTLIPRNSSIFSFFFRLSLHKT